MKHSVSAEKEKQNNSPAPVIKQTFGVLDNKKQITAEIHRYNNTGKTKRNLHKLGRCNVILFI